MAIRHYYDMIWDVLPWWDCAGEDARKEFLAALDKRCSPEEKKARMERDFKKANYDRAVDYSNDVRRLGDCYVYAWISEKRGLFYIGSGDAHRVVSVVGRSRAFQEIVDHERTKIVLMCLNIHKSVAMEVEKGCIWLAQLRGANLLNKDFVLSQYELEILSKSLIGDNPNIDFLESFRLDHEEVVYLMRAILDGAYDFTDDNRNQQIFCRNTRKQAGIS